MPIVGRLDQFGSMIVTGEFNEVAGGNVNINGFGTYYASEFNENIGIANTLTANVFAPYQIVDDEFAGVLYGPGQGKFMSQTTGNVVIVYNEIDEIGLSTSYTLTPESVSSNEGGTVTLTVSANNVPDGTEFYYEIVDPIVTSGLVLNLDAGNTASYPGSGITWTDLSGNGNNATLTNGPTYSSANNGSIVFDGTSNYGTVSNNITSGTGDFAVSVWVYKTETSTNRYICDFGANGGTIGAISGKFFYYNPTTGAGSVLYTSGPTCNINTWYNIVISRISGTTYFYSNSSLILSGTDAGNIGSSGTVLTIGNYGGGGNYYHQGNISNILVYKNKGLSSAEVLQNYNVLRGRYGL